MLPIPDKQNQADAGKLHFPATTRKLDRVTILRCINDASFHKIPSLLSGKFHQTHLQCRVHTFCFQSKNNLFLLLCSFNTHLRGVGLIESHPPSLHIHTLSPCPCVLSAPFHFYLFRHISKYLFLFLKIYEDSLSPKEVFLGTLHEAIIIRLRSDFPEVFFFFNISQYVLPNSIINNILP